jgi:hypothetical protein
MFSASGFTSKPHATRKQADGGANRCLSQVGDIVGRVLKGEKPENFPVRQVKKIELVINAKTANSLGPYSSRSRCSAGP